jgi:hypothetical protein
MGVEQCSVADCAEVADKALVLWQPKVEVGEAASARGQDDDSHDPNSTAAAYQPAAKGIPSALAL